MATGPLADSVAPNPVGGESKPKGFVYNIMRFSVHDGPGIRTTVFFKGCPLSCWWCHNPESRSNRPDLMYSAERCVRCASCVAACPNHAIRWKNGPVWDSGLCRFCGDCAEACPTEARQLVGKWMTVDEVLAEIRRDTVFYDESGGGVTLSGGEPLAQPEFAEALVEACRAEGIHTAIETCGAAPRETIFKIGRTADLVLFDLKLMNPVRHKEFTGASNLSILKNLEALARAGVALMVRIPLIPGINDDEDNLVQTRQFLHSIGINKVDLLPYHEIGVEKYKKLGMDYRLKGLKPPAQEHVGAIAEEFQRDGFAIRVGG
jgi:pyruvate formate lyase activating enzyme